MKHLETFGRIKIRDRDKNDTTVYDNQIGDSERE